MTKETTIYMWRDAGDMPIYYGITKDMAARQRAHDRYGAWKIFACTYSVETVGSRERAIERERELIQRDKPIFNRKHNDTPEAKARLIAYLTEHDRLDLLQSSWRDRRPPIRTSAALAETTKDCFFIDSRLTFELREVVAQLETLTHRRDGLIRAGLAEKIRVAELAEDAQLSVPRIYQIRDRRR